MTSPLPTLASPMGIWAISIPTTTFLGPGYVILLTISSHILTIKRPRVAPNLLRKLSSEASIP